MSLIDTHAHLDEEAFEPDRAEVIRRAEEAGLAGIITIGLTRATSEAAVALAQQYPLVYAAVGIQPNYVHESPQVTGRQLRWPMIHASWRSVRPVWTVIGTMLRSICRRNIFSESYDVRP